MLKITEPVCMLLLISHIPSKVCSDIELQKKIGSYNERSVLQPTFEQFFFYFQTLDFGRGGGTLLPLDTI